MLSDAAFAMRFDGADRLRYGGNNDPRFLNRCTRNDLAVGFDAGFETAVTEAMGFRRYPKYEISNKRRKS